MKNKITGNVYAVNLNQDIRKWQPDLNDISLNMGIALPANILKGDYELYLRFADPESSLKANPLYAIRLANQNTWDAASGNNSLLATITVN